MGYPDDHGRAGTTGAYEPVYDAATDHPHADRSPPDLPPPSHPGPAGPPGHRAAAQPRRRRLPLVVGGGALGVVVLVGAGVGLSKLLGGGHHATATAGATGATAAPSGSPTSPAVSALPTGPLGAMLASRSTDPHPLTLGEAFRRKVFTVNGVHYVLTAAQATRSCTRTAHGAKLVSALRAGRCSQMLRGTFARADGGLAGTVGVANLGTARAASLTAKVANATKDAYLRPLPGRGVTKNLGKGIAFASAEARGHYVLLSWIQAPNGKAVPRAMRKGATVFEPSVIYGSRLGFALQYRGIAGKPYGT
ncbi:MAG TPA: hypothetical protein VF069_25935 [Streptosporangiaceae bacterium]